MKTKAVVFDAYGTLFDVNSAAEKCKEKIGAKWEGFSNFWIRFINFHFFNRKKIIK